MNLFGITEFAARFPNAVCGALVLPALYQIGRRFRGHLFGLCWALCYVGSFLPHFYFRSGIIDPYFNAFMFFSIVFLAAANLPKCSRPFLYTAVSGIFTGLAVLTKGPVGLLVVGATWSIVWFWNTLSSAAERGPLKLVSSISLLLTGIPWKRIGIFLASMSLASLTWFAVISLQDGGFFVSEFLRYQVRLLQTQDAGHGGPIYYHVVAILLGCFPASFMLFDLKKSFLSDLLKKDSFARWMLVVGLFVLILFSLVQTKIVHYSSMTYYPLTFFAALLVERCVRGEQRPSRFLKISFFSFVVLLSLVFVGIAFVGAHPERVAPLIRDDMARAALLEQSGTWFFGQYFVSAPLILFALVAVVLWKNGRRLGAVTSIAGGVSGLILLLSWLLAPSVEEIAQGPLIRFAKTAAQRGCDVDVIGHKSFIQLYYGQRMPDSSMSSETGSESVSRPQSRWEERTQRLSGPWKRPVVLMAKVRNLDSVVAENQLKVIKQKQGFAYLFRPAAGIADEVAACGFLSE